MLKKYCMNCYIENVALSYDEETVCVLPHLTRQQKKINMENPSYHAVLVRLFTYKDGIHYDRGHEFLEDDLRRLTQEEVLNYFKLRCYGT